MKGVFSKFLILLALVGLSMTVGCKGGGGSGGNGNEIPKERASKDALINAGLEAIKNNKPDDYIKLMGTMDDLKKYCPEMFDAEAMLKKMPEEDRKAAGAEAKKMAEEGIKEMEAGMKKEMAERPKKIKKALKKCNELIDFKKAKQVKIKGGDKKEEQEMADVCPKAVELEDIKVTFEVDGKKFKVKLDDPVVFDGKLYGFMDKPKCEKD